MRKKSFFALVFLIAVGSAFTTAKPGLPNPTGYYSGGSGATNAADCGLNSGTNCSVGSNTPVYDNPNFIGDGAHVMKRQ